MSKQVIGRCSLCGGQVTLPMIWHGINQPVATCSKCNAIQSNQHLPTIPMEQPVDFKNNNIWKWVK